jgi:hypothetical protein
LSLYKITDKAGLHRHLAAALQLEHATIPPYLTAMYSIKPGTNTEAYHILRAVAVEEMLHLTLAANILNAVGGDPDMTVPGFVPLYPAYLPDGETDFQVDCQRFSPAAIETFLKIERPAEGATAGVDTIHKGRKSGHHGGGHKRHGTALKARHVHADEEEHFFSIGEFYQAIEEGLERLHAEMGDALFSGDPARQISQEYYYSAGGSLTPVTDLASAKAAIRLISEQGEGVTDNIFDFEGEIAHYYRFEQLLRGRYYQPGDTRGHPTGRELKVDWDEVFPIKANARLADFAAGSDLRHGAETFNRTYAEFLALLTQSLRGRPELFVEAVGVMFQLKDMSYQLMRHPIGDAQGLHGAPTFEINNG